MVRKTIEKRNCEICSNEIFPTNSGNICKQCKKEKNIEKNKCSNCGKNIQPTSKSGLCSKHYYEMKRLTGKEKRKNKLKICLKCNKDIPKTRKLSICYNCEREEKRPKCENINCKNKVHRKRDKFCSKSCGIIHRNYLKRIKLNLKEEEYKLYIKRKDLKLNSRICKIHNKKITSEDGCIDCIIKKQNDEYNKKLENAWKKCSDCGRLIRKGRLRCRNCVTIYLQNQY